MYDNHFFWKELSSMLLTLFLNSEEIFLLIILVPEPLYEVKLGINLIKIINFSLFKNSVSNIGNSFFFSLEKK